MNNFDSLKYSSVVLFTVEIIIAVLLEFVFKVRYASVILIFVVVNAGFVAYIIYTFVNDDTRKKLKIKEIVDGQVDEAIQFGNVGIVAYNEDFTIVWMSDLFTNQSINYVGSKVTMWLPEVTELFKGNVDSITVNFQDHQYLVQRRDTNQVLYFKDITEQLALEQQATNSQAVVGVINLDNYAETVQYEDEQKIALINANLRQSVAEWCQSHGMMARRTRSDRFIIFTKYENYLEAYEERFSILNDIRNEAANLEVAITLSMAFAYGTSDYVELDAMVNELLELAQNRGGDQVAVRKYGQETEFFGGTSETSEKRSGVRIRVMAQSIRGMIESSDSIFIIGHDNMDFDCMGAAIGVSRIATALGKPAYIVANNIRIEAKLEAQLVLSNDELMQMHQFVSEQDALTMITNKSLIIVVDHHTVDLSSAPELLKKAKKTLVIDHHRRRKDDNIIASMVYLEASASSTTELVVELMEYQPQKIVLIETEANIMFAGILVDTDHFRSHCSARTFEAASMLKQWGADTQVADDMLKDTYKEFELQNRILSYSERVYDNIIIAPIDTNEVFNRTLLSKAANFLLTVQNVKAAFVVAHIDEETVAVSARSNGEINVQVIMEMMNGGGHFSAAALQRKDTTVGKIKGELIEAINKYQEEEKKENESNPIV